MTHVGLRLRASFCSGYAFCIIMTEAAPGLAFELLERERVLVSYAGPNATQPDVWEPYLALMEAKISSSLRFLVFQEGSMPSVRDQQRLGALSRPHSPRVALVSTSLSLRFAVSAFSLINKRIKFFTPDELPQAFAHLDLRPWEQPAVLACVERLKAKVSGG